MSDESRGFSHGWGCRSETCHRTFVSNCLISMTAVLTGFSPSEIGQKRLDRRERSEQRKKEKGALVSEGQCVSMMIRILLLSSSANSIVIRLQRLPPFVIFVIFCSIPRFQISSKTKSTCHEFGVRPVDVKRDCTPVNDIQTRCSVDKRIPQSRSASTALDQHRN